MAFVNGVIQDMRNKNSAQCAQFYDQIRIVVYLMIIAVFFLMLAILLDWAAGITSVILLIIFFMVLYMGYIVSTNCLDTGTPSQVIRVMNDGVASGTF